MFSPSVGEAARFEDVIDEVGQALDIREHHAAQQFDQEQAAEELRYEAAAIYRDWIAMVRDTSERQKMILEGQDDMDLFGYAQDGTQLAMAVFAMRRIENDQFSPVRQLLSAR